jgi:uncharacterized protein YndB with AHSA1/START domain
MTRPEFVYVIYIQSTPEAVWEALTAPEFTAQYWGGRRVESEWTAGSTVRHLRPDGGSCGEGKVLVADVPRRLSYTFHLRLAEDRVAEHPARVTFEIEAIGPTVKLTLRHDHADDSPRRRTMEDAWPVILSSLKSLLETGQPLTNPGHT